MNVLLSRLTVAIVLPSDTSNFPCDGNYPHYCGHFADATQGTYDGQFTFEDNKNERRE